MLLEKPFRYYIRLNWRPFTLGLVCLLFTNTFECLTPLILREVIDNLSKHGQLSAIYKPLSIYFGIIFVIAFFRFGWRIYFGRYHHSVAEDLRNQIFYKFTSLGPSFFDRKPVGQLMSLITNDVNYFRMGIGPAILLFFDAAFYCLTIIPIMIYLSPAWTIKTLIAFPLIPFFVAAIEKKIQSNYFEKQNKFSLLSGIAQEIVSGIRIIKGFALESIQTNLFNKTSREFENASNKSATAEALLEPTLQLTVVIGIVVLFYVGTPEVIAGTATLGTFIAFLRYVQKLMWPMSEIGYGINMVLEARASFSRIEKVLSEPIDVPDTGKTTPVEFNHLRINDLTFSYAGSSQAVLHKISLEIKKGERIGLFGAVGSGKSTLINLICRLYEVPKNKIFINDHPLEQIALPTLRELICVVPQNTFLFGETIAANLALGLADVPDQSELEKFSRTVRIHDEIVSTENGYNTLLGEKGINLSGGQKQRISIGRGLIRNSPVVVLDDVLSAVDADTEKAILNNLNQHLVKQTVVVVSHRILSLLDCDRIYVFDRGHIVATGTHKELLQSSPLYKNVNDLQTEKSPSTLYPGINP